MDATAGAVAPVEGRRRRWSGKGALHGWDRYDGLWAGLFYVTLGVPTVSSLFDGELVASQRATAVVAVVVVSATREAVVAWMLRHLAEGADIRFRPADAGHRPAALAWAVLTLAGLVVLVEVNPAFYFALYGMFPQAFTILPRNWAIAFAGTLFPVVLVAEGGLSTALDSGLLTTAAGSILVSLVLGVFIHEISRESQQRHAAIVAFEAARAETESLQRQLVEAARAAGGAEERARLAREIHDTLAQGFVSVLTQLEAADDGSSRLPDRVAERLSRARAIARSSLGEARRSVAALRPAELDGAPLPEAVERIVRRWSLDSGVAAACTVTGAPFALAPAAEVTLLRAVQEALANVARHAGAAAVNVTLSYLGDAALGDVALDVHDDGRGFDPDLPASGGDGGFGLVALRQRVDGAGGTVGIESGAGEGTTVTVRLPRGPGVV